MSENGKAVFLSYASQDAEAVQRLAEALRAAGVEVWFDRNELVGGDAWDAKIRRQIAECALFVPVISASTQARREGYFRLEWRIAAQRTHMMSEQVAFLLPVVIDDTRDAAADVPAEFKQVQWTRLPGGETTAAFGARVQRLLETGGVADRAASAPMPPPRPAAPAGASGRGLSWVGYAGAAVGVGLGLFYAVRPLWRPAREPAAGPAPAAAAPATLTEAQRLVARAREILDQGDELNRENYALAEELLKRAQAADVTEASAWSLHAWLSADLYRYGLDRTEARLAQIQAQASRAASLAPASLDAQVAVLRSQTAARAAPEEIARRQAELAERFPDDPRVYRLFGLSHAKDSTTFRMLRRGLERWPDDARLQGDLLNSLLLGGRYAEASELAEKFTRGRTGARVLAVQVFLQLWWHGDAAAAAASVARWPSWLLLEDRGAALAAITARMNRNPEGALEVLRRFPRDYIRDSFYTGPRSALIALASEAAGQPESAEAEWRVVLQVCDRELAAAPNDGAALHWRAWALARLGRPDEARQVFRVLLQRRVAIEGSAQVTGGLAGLALVLDDREEALRELARLGSYDPMRTRPPSRALFDLNPLFDTLRGDPRFQALRDAAPAPAPAGAAPSAAGSAPAEGKSVAVLAFANLSDDRSNEYFSDGISEELLNVLAKVPGLKVSARTSAFYFKGKQVPLADIARQLGVAYVVEGSVRRAGDKVRIQAQLVKAEDGFRVWSDTFTRDIKDVFAVQDEIAGLIAQNLSLTLGASSARRTAAVEPRAIELYVQARQAWSLRTPEGFARAEQMLNRALELAPDFVRARAALLDVVQMRSFRERRAGTFAQRHLPELDQRLTQIRDVLAIDPDLAEAYSTMGQTLDASWRREEAGRAYRRATELNPNYATGRHWYGMHLAEIGRMDEALEELKVACDLDPFSFIILDNYGWLLGLAGRNREALQMLDRAAALNPGFDQTARARAAALVALGRQAEAEAVARQLRNSQRELDIWTLGLVGLTGEAQALLERMDPREVTNRFQALLAAGQREAALAALADPSGASKGDVIDLLYRPMFDSVRADPRFIQYLAVLDITEAHARAQAWRAANPAKGVP